MRPAAAARLHGAGRRTLLQPAFVAGDRTGSVLTTQSASRDGGRKEARTVRGTVRSMGSISSLPKQHASYTLMLMKQHASFTILLMNQHVYYIPILSHAGL